MAQPYVGEIRMFAGNFAPAGWMFCEGQLLPISENETLFQLIGTTYGGDGESTFALPDLRGRLPIHQGNGFVLGRDRRGRGDHADDRSRSRPHHPLLVEHGAGGTTTARTNNVLARSPTIDLYREAALTTALARRCDRARWAARSRTRTSSRTCASTSSSRCSASSRARPRRQAWPIHSSPRSASSRSTSRPRAGRGATGSCCRSRRTRRSSRCWARPTGATASRTSRCPTSRARRRCTRARGRASASTILGETGGSETVTLLESEIPLHTHLRLMAADSPGTSRRHGGRLARALGRWQRVPDTVERRT